jgi:predicted amidohydrolase YtcJ
MSIQRIVSGLAVVCALAGHPLFAQSNLPSEIVAYADIVLYNGKVTTADDQFTIAEAVAIRDGKFLATGPNARILAMAGPKTVKFDLQGRSALPGLIDTHLHQAWVTDEPPPPGERPLRLRMDTLQGAIDELKAIVARAKPGEFIGLSGPSNKVIAVELNAAYRGA